MKKLRAPLYLVFIIEVFLVFILIGIYNPLCAFIFATIPMSKALKILMIPIVEEFLRLVSIIIGGATQYGFTLVFAILEFRRFISGVGSVYSAVPDGFYFYRFLCIFVHIGLLYIQIKFYREYQKTKRPFFVLYGFLIAVIVHELYNYKIGLIILNLVSDI